MGDTFFACGESLRRRSAMAWKEVSVMGQRNELVALMRAPGGPGVAELCRRFGVSRKTAYKWAGRDRASPRPFPEALPAIEYGPGDEVVTVGATGLACYAGR